MFIHLCLVIIFLLVIYFKNYLRAVTLAFTLSGPKVVPIFGNALIFKNPQTMVKIAKDFSKKYGPIMRIWISLMPIFFVAEPHHLQVILGSKRHTNKNFFYCLLHNIIGRGLVSNSGQKWKTHRKLIQPYFHINILENYLNTFSKKSQELVKDLENHTDYIKITNVINKTLLLIQLETILGLSEEEQSKHPFRDRTYSAQDRITKPWLLLDSIFKFTQKAKIESQQSNHLYEYTKQVLEMRRTGGEKNVKNNLSLLDIFIDIASNNKDFTDEDIINETFTFMLAGQDSVSSAVVFTLFYLAKYEDVQKNVLIELDKIFDNDTRHPSLADLNDMKYLEQCIKESLRLCPTVPMFGRQVTEDINLGKFIIPAGSNIIMSPFITHRLEHIFPEPEKFDPDRFLPENAAKHHPFAYIPFSAGPRNCVGYKFGLLEMKTVISTILRRYKISVKPGHENLNIAYSVSLRAKGGIWIKFQKRELIL